MNRIELIILIKNKCYKKTILPWGQPEKQFDRKVLSDNLEIMAESAKQLDEKLPKNIDFLVGIANGGIEFTNKLSEISGVEGRILKKNTDGSLGNIITPSEVSGKRVLLIDDTVYRGKRVIEAGEILGNNGANVLGIACIVLRGDVSGEPLKRQGFNIYPLFRGDELMETR